MSAGVGDVHDVRDVRERLVGVFGFDADAETGVQRSRDSNAADSRPLASRGGRCPGVV